MNKERCSHCNQLKNEEELIYCFHCGQYYCAECASDYENVCINCIDEILNDIFDTYKETA